jgi:transmembrane sensor
MNEERFWELVALQLSGEARTEELHELEQLLQQNPEWGFRKDMFTAVWNTKHSSQAIDGKTSFNKHLQRLSNHLSEPVLQYEMDEISTESLEENNTPSRSYSKLLWISGIAAAVLLVLFLSVNFLFEKKGIKPHANNTISTKRGSKSKVQLPDGTEVWLNADSRITYNENFQGSQREVQLSGEAFFDVVRDESRPFIIHTNTIDVKVLGTAFNVRSYENEKNTETSLIRGSVEITLVKSPDKKKIILKPNDKLIVNNNEATLVGREDRKKNSYPLLTLSKIKYQEEDSSALETLWVKNKLVFDAEPVEDIALKIERWYDVKVVIADEKLKKTKFSATFEDEDLKTVLEALRLVGIRSTVNKKEVILK